MATVKALKLLVAKPIALSSGRSDIPTIRFDASSANTIGYNMIVDENPFSPNCNIQMINQYLAEGIFTIGTGNAVAITVQPAVHTAVAIAAMMDYSVTATGDATIEYEWKISSDSGNTWSVIGTASSINIAAISTTVRSIKVRVYNSVSSVDSTVISVPAGT